MSDGVDLPVATWLRVAFLLLALFAEIERTFIAERAAHARDGAMAVLRNGAGADQALCVRRPAVRNTLCP